MRIIALLFLLIITSCDNSKNDNKAFALGLNIDEQSYGNVLRKAQLTRGLYRTPKRFSLKEYLPDIENQGQYSTCVGWASAYYARTILWAKRKKLSKKDIRGNAFSPSFVYKMIGGVTDCSEGTQIERAMGVMASTGVPFFKDFSDYCPSSIPEHLQNIAGEFKIESFTTLFSPDDSRDIKNNTTKKALAEGNPVVIGMGVTHGFMNERDGFWNVGNETKSDIKGYHAMCVIGYDDDKNGGSFEIVNSWSKNWGEEGFIWVKYEDYANFTFQAFEMIDNIKPTPDIEDSEYLSGSLRLVLPDESEMSINSNNKRGLEVEEGEDNENHEKIEDNINYRVNKQYKSGTKFRILLFNKQPAYVYMIATDKTLKITQLFPHRKDISPALIYSENEIALPSEVDYIKMDNVKGEDIFCLLYSKEELNISKIISKMESRSGTFFDKLSNVLKDKLVPSSDIEYDVKKISFKSRTNKQQTIVPIIVEIPHK